MYVLNNDIAGVHDFFKTKLVWFKPTIYPCVSDFQIILCRRLSLSDSIWEDVMCHLKYHTNMKFNISSEDSLINKLISSITLLS